GRFCRWVLIPTLGLWLLSIACISQVTAGELADNPPSFPDSNSRSLEAQFESLSESHRLLMEQLQRTLEQNEALSVRLNALEAGRPAQPVPPDDGASDAATSASAATANESQTPSSGPPPFDSTTDDNYSLKSLFDSFHSPPGGKKSKPWYDRLTIRGYSQIR